MVGIEEMLRDMLAGNRARFAAGAASKFDFRFFGLSVMAAGQMVDGSKKAIRWKLKLKKIYDFLAGLPPYGLARLANARARYFHFSQCLGSHSLRKHILNRSPTHKMVILYFDTPKIHLSTLHVRLFTPSTDSQDTSSSQNHPTSRTQTGPA